MDLLKWEQDKNLYLFTSLSSGSSHIITATNRIETILRSARIPFTYIDTATNDSAKALFQRRGKGKKLPFLVKEGFVIGDLEQVEEWNEFGQLKEAIGPVESKDTSIIAPPAKMMAASGSSSTTTSAAAPLAGAVPTPTKALEIAAESSSPPAPMPGATPIPAAAMSALAMAAQETAARAKAKQTGSTTLAATETKGPTPTLAAEPTTVSDTNPEETKKSAEKSEKEEDKDTTKSVTEPPKLGHDASTGGLSTVSSIASTTASTHQGHISPTPFVPEHFQPPATTHRGSSVSLVSEEEIREVERRETIQEEPEEAEAEEGKEIDAVAEKVKDVKLDDEEKKSAAEESKKAEEKAVEQPPPAAEEKKPETTS